MGTLGSWAGAAIGLAGAQALIFVIWALFSDPCECLGKALCDSDALCVGGMTQAAFWVQVGGPMSVAFGFLGAMISRH